MARSIQPPAYWTWFFKGSGGKPGFRRLVNLWLAFHIVVGLSLSYLVKSSLDQCANAVLLPLAGILIGLSFAWAGNAQALLQSKEIGKLTEHHEGGFVEYVYVYQTAILTILIALILWGLAGLKIFEDQWPTSSCEVGYFTVKALLFLFSSMALRECWHIVLSVQWMLIAQQVIQKKLKDDNKNNEQ